MNEEEDKATIERRRLLEVWKIKETLLSRNHRDLGIPRKRQTRLEQKWMATLLRIHVARQLPVSNNSQADCSCIIKGTTLISWRIHGEREREKKMAPIPISRDCWIFVQRIVKRTSLDSITRILNHPMCTKICSRTIFKRQTRKNFSLNREEDVQTWKKGDVN